MRGIGVQQRVGILQYTDMAFPENQIATGQIPAHGCPQHGFLHVAVARAGMAAHGQGNLHQCGTIKAEAFAPAPKIRHADETFRDLHKIIGMGSFGINMASKNI